MSAPERSRRPSRFTFNMPSPVHAKPSYSHSHHHKPLAHHPPAPTSFLTRKQDSTARRRKVTTPHPITTHTHKAAFVDYRVSPNLSPTLSPSSCVISDVPLPSTPTSVTESPVSYVRQQRWSHEMRRQCDDDEDEHGSDARRHIVSPNVLSSSSCSVLSPVSASSPSSCLDTPTSPSSPACTHTTALVSHAITTQPPHRRVHSDPLPLPAASSTSSLARRLNLRPLDIPPGKDGDIVLLTALSPLPITHLTEQRQWYDAEEAGVEALLSGPALSLADCWYGRSEWQSPVTGSGMRDMAQQQQHGKASQLPFASLCSVATAAHCEWYEV